MNPATLSASACVPERKRSSREKLRSQPTALAVDGKRVIRRHLRGKTTHSYRFLNLIQGLNKSAGTLHHIVVYTEAFATRTCCRKWNTIDEGGVAESNSSTKCQDKHVTSKTREKAHHSVPGLSWSVVLPSGNERLYVNEHSRRNRVEHQLTREYLELGTRLYMYQIRLEMH